METRPAPNTTSPATLLLLMSLLLMMMLASTGCPLTYQSNRRDSAGRERIYQIAENEAFAIARESLIAVDPEGVIEEIDRPARALPAWGYKLSTSSGLGKSRYEILVYRVEGSTKAGETVSGYYLRTTSVSAKVIVQDR
jgi:hypothetical protein